MEDGVISGVVVFSQAQAILVANILDGQVDHVLLDAEKKIGINVGVDDSVLKHFKIDSPSINSKSRVRIEMGNISAAARPFITSSYVTEFKPNDISVNAIWTHISLKLGNCSGRKVAIIGCGNIGFKLALKLVETGVNVEVVRRDATKGMLMANAINMIKPETTIATATYNQNPLQASLFCDALVGCTPGIPVISWEMIQSMAPDGFVVDVGKGTIDPEVINQAIESGVELIRTDVTPALYGFISMKRQMQHMIDHGIGRKQVEEGIWLVSGGALGAKDDVIVDNYNAPKSIYGICDGLGDLKKELSADDKQKLESIKRQFSLLD